MTYILFLSPLLNNSLALPQLLGLRRINLLAQVNIQTAQGSAQMHAVLWMPPCPSAEQSSMHGHTLDACPSCTEDTLNCADLRNPVKLLWMAAYKQHTALIQQPQLRSGNLTSILWLPATQRTTILSLCQAQKRIARNFRRANEAKQISNTSGNLHYPGPRLIDWL